MIRYKRIIYVGSFLFPNPDAATLRVLNNARLINELGYNVTFLSYQSAEKNRETGSYDGLQYICTSDERKIGWGYFKRFINFLFYGHKALIYLVRNCSRYDVIILYNPFLFISASLWLITKLKQKKLVSDLTEWYSSSEFPGGKFFLPFWLNELNMRVVQLFVKNKILISSYLRNYYRNGNLIVIPPLVNLNDSKWDLQKKTHHSEKIHIMYAGTPQYKDNLKVVVAAVMEGIESGLPLKLTILGVRKDEFESSSLKLNDNNDVTENIIFKGYVSHSEVLEAYRETHLSILLRDKSRKNSAGFPTKLVESIATGTPVIVNETSNVFDYLNDGFDCFRISDTNYKTLLAKLYEICRLDVNRLNYMSLNALKTTRYKFNTENYKTSMSSFMRNVCEN